MLNVIRYVNGKKVEKEDLSKYEIESDMILTIIKTVNERVQKKFHQDTLVHKK